MQTDAQFDSALTWLAKVEGSTKSKVVRSLVMERVHAKQHGFRFGALHHHFPELEREPAAIVAALKQDDSDVPD